MPYLQTGNKSLFYTRTKATSPRTSFPELLLIHGLGSSHSFYSPVTDELSASGYSSVSLDTYGSGLSRLADGTPDPSIQSIVEDIIDLIPALGLTMEHVVAIGHSMGAIVVAELAARCNIRGAVLIGPVLPKAQLSDVFGPRIRTVLKDGMEPIAEAIPSAATGSKCNPTQKAFIRSLLLSQDPKGYAALCQAIVDAQRPMYASARCSLLIVAGEEDKTSQMLDSQKILFEWGCDKGEKQIEVVEGVGHWHCIEAAEEVGHVINNFLAGLH